VTSRLILPSCLSEMSLDPVLPAEPLRSTPRSEVETLIMTGNASENDVLEGVRSLAMTTEFQPVSQPREQREQLSSSPS
jgi:hypothetical protein